MDVNIREARCEPAHRVAVLAVGLPDRDREQLERIFRHTNWELRALPTLALSLAQLPAPVVLCDRHLPDGSWRELLRQAHNWRNPPRVIVTSPAADNALWAEVLNLGGYDVLARPFVPDEVYRSLALASHSWLDQEDRERMTASAAHP
jgi:DNA-binding response OmpR family regulator